MRRARVLTAAVLLSGLAVMGGAGQALADDGPTAQTGDSPGILSGDNIQVPVTVPINACGDTVDILALLNPASNSTCTNDHN
ncbi:chaplin [Streptomyces sp. NPDC058308]|uniref:chaplin n=1 Tax=Streptomyces sp. NPDC058308 TaxID=3346440 RepID=UPI0036F149E5